MAPMSQEDLEWFRSTFHPIPRPQLPEDAIEYSLYLISSNPTPALTDAVAETRSRLQEVQKSASELTKNLLKDYIWQREGFGLEMAKENGACLIEGAQFRRRHRLTTTMQESYFYGDEPTTVIPLRTSG
jgi:hypothetical protein